jgi:DNA-binding transcriptional MerR regulator
MKELLTLKEIAQQIGVPESNLRYYRNRIGEYLPSAGKGRRRRYYPEAAEIFRRTVEMVQEGVSLDRVHRNLASEKPVEIETAGPISQEELIGRLADKITERLEAAGKAAGDGREEGPGRIGLLAGELERTRQRLSELEELLRDKGRAEEAAARWESESGRLRAELEAAGDEIRALKEQLKEKERVVELQKAQLIDARSKRVSIEGELIRIRELLEKSAGGRAR